MELLTVKTPNIKKTSLNLDEATMEKLQNIMGFTSESMTSVVKQAVAIYQWLLYEQEVNKRAIYTADADGREKERLRLLA
jgi:hypothetical protein